jgi:hypothetical protein
MYHPEMRRGLLFGVAAFACAPAAFAATWTKGTTPYLGQIFAIDATEEPNWPYGSKDVLGDGPQFDAAEQALQLRTAYASANATQLWTRVYVSSQTAVDTTLTVFVFIDSDKNTATGGGTSSTTLSPMFTSEHSPGGYDYVLGIVGNGTIANVWQWATTPTPGYVVVSTTPTQTAAEIGADVDPILIAFNGSMLHGYVQGRVDLGIVGLTQACDANLYVRSARPTGPSDLDMKYYTSCVPAATNGVPTIVDTGCTSDAQCPQNGVCVNAACVVAQPCIAATDCPANDTCTADGRCVPATGACTQGGTDCGAGFRCAPNGTCVAGGTTTGNGEVEGGAFHCDVAPKRKSTALLGLLAGLLAILHMRRRRG